MCKHKLGYSKGNLFWGFVFIIDCFSFLMLHTTWEAPVFFLHMLVRVLLNRETFPYCFVSTLPCDWTLFLVVTSGIISLLDHMFLVVAIDYKKKKKQKRKNCLPVSWQLVQYRFYITSHKAVCSFLLIEFYSITV